MSVEIAAETHLPLIIETAVGKTQSPQKPPHCFILPCQNGVHSHKLRPVRVSHGEGLKFIYKIYNTTQQNIIQLYNRCAEEFASWLTICTEQTILQ